MKRMLYSIHKKFNVEKIVIKKGRIRFDLVLKMIFKVLKSTLGGKI